MTLRLITNFAAGNEGDTAIFKDITGATASTAYSRNGNVSYADIDSIRLKIATLSSINNVTTLNATDAMTPYVEYICTQGSGTIDGKAVSVGNYFVPNTTSLVVPSGMIFETTGNYVYPWIAQWLPTAAQVPLTISLSEMNQSGNTTMEDDMYILNYEVYVNSFSSTQAAVVNQQYLVISGTCVYSGSTYRAGDIFIASSTSNIVIVSASVALLNATCQNYFIITFNMTQTLFEILPVATPQTNAEINVMLNQIEGLTFACKTGDVSYTLVEGLLAKLESQTILLLNNN